MLHVGEIVCIVVAVGSLGVDVDTVDLYGLVEQREVVRREVRLVGDFYGLVGLSVGFRSGRFFGYSLLQVHAKSPSLVHGERTGIDLVRDDAFSFVGIGFCGSRNEAQGDVVFRDALHPLSVERQGVGTFLDFLYGRGGRYAEAYDGVLRCARGYGSGAQLVDEERAERDAVAELVRGVVEVRHVNDALRHGAHEAVDLGLDGVELGVDFFLVVEVGRLVLTLVGVLIADESELVLEVLYIEEHLVQCTLVGLARDGGDFVHHVSLPVLESFQLVVDLLSRGVSLFSEESIQFTVDFGNGRGVGCDVARGEVAPLAFQSRHAVGQGGELGVVSEVEVGFFEGLHATFQGFEVGLCCSEVGEGTAQVFA